MDYALAQKDGSDQVIEDKPLNEWLTPMIQQNDINATNVLINNYGMGNMNSYFKDQGYLTHTLNAVWWISMSEVRIRIITLLE